MHCSGVIKTKRHFRHEVNFYYFSLREKLKTFNRSDVKFSCAMMDKFVVLQIVALGVRYRFYLNFKMDNCTDILLGPKVFGCTILTFTGVNKLTI